MSKQKDWIISEEEKKEQEKFADKVKRLLQKNYPDQMPMAHVFTFGCQQNIADGERIKGMLALMGYGFTDSPDDADLVLYNTCAVRENAEDRVFGNIGELKHVKQRRPNMIVGLCGCMMQQTHIVERLKKSYPHVDLIFGTHVIHQLPENLYRALHGKKRVVQIPDSDGVIAEDLPVRRDGTFKAWIPIMYGCNNFCTYCIVPYVRGRERSREPQIILDEIRELIKEGYKEFTLLGQNVNSYGKGLDEEISFAQLLRLINDLDGEFRIRFMTSHPKDATKELIDTIAACDKVCNHIHLPVQSGSDRVLKAMNRHYDRAHYMELVNYARKTLPGLSFTSDIIVGFPTETEEDFCETVRLIQEVGYDSIFTFIYSKRVGTKAAEMEGGTSEEEKSNRFSRLLKAQKELAFARYEDYVGQTIRVLAEGEGKTGADYLTGRADNYLIVDFKADASVIGQFVDVKITKALNWALLGEICDS